MLEACENLFEPLLPLERFAALRFVERHRAALSVGLRPVERDVRIHQRLGQFLPLRAVLGHADRTADAQLLLLVGNRLADALDDRFRRTHALGGRVRRRNNGDELVAADPRDDLEALADGGEPLGDGPDDEIAGLVTVRVVHFLEPVEIDVQHGETRRLARPRVGVEFGEALLHRATVGQSRQIVDQRHFPRSGGWRRRRLRP